MAILPVFVIVTWAKSATVARVHRVSSRLVLVNRKNVTRYIFTMVSICCQPPRIQDGTVNLINLNINGDGIHRAYPFKELISSGGN